MLTPNIWENKKCSKPPTSKVIGVGVGVVSVVSVVSVVVVSVVVVVVPPFHHGQHMWQLTWQLTWQPGTESVACTGGILFSFRLVEQQMAAFS